MIYLDNAATTYPKPKCVYAALKKSLKQAVGNPGRSSHRAALLATEEIYSAREAISDFLSFGAPERIVFTQNASYALNMALHALTPRPRHAIYSDREHNSVIRPIEAMEKEGLSHTVFKTDGDLLCAMEAAMQPQTYLCVISLCSNVTGECFPLPVLREFRKRHRGVRIILDGSQWLGHLPFSLEEPICDVLCAPGHKALFGLQGAGFALFATEGEYTPFCYGGSGNDSERGTCCHRNRRFGKNGRSAGSSGTDAGRWSPGMASAEQPIEQHGEICPPRHPGVYRPGSAGQQCADLPQEHFP
jgi:selenocysteine lyase/cysteine desulfurase